MSAVSICLRVGGFASLRGHCCLSGLASSSGRGGGCIPHFGPVRYAGAALCRADGCVSHCVASCLELIQAWRRPAESVGRPRPPGSRISRILRGDILDNLIPSRSRRYGRSSPKI